MIDTFVNISVVFLIIGALLSFNILFMRLVLSGYSRIVQFIKKSKILVLLVLLVPFAPVFVGFLIMVEDIIDEMNS